jgi:hypothetical protein
LERLPGHYSIGESPERWNIPFNKEGWNQTTGEVKSCVILFLQDLQFLELELAPAARQLTEAALRDVRAKVGLEVLERESLTWTAAGWQVRFAGPRCPQHQRGVQPVFVAFGPKEKLAELRTPYRLLRVRWRAGGDR